MKPDKFRSFQTQAVADRTTNSIVIIWIETTAD